MKKLVATALATTSLLTIAGLAIASGPADLGLDRNRMFFRYITPSVDSVDFQMLPDNVHNPIVLPCDVQVFGGQFDLDYTGTGPTVYPKLIATFFDDQGRSIGSSGCLGNTQLTNIVGTFNPMTAGSVQTDGYTLISSTNTFCPWLFQPGDLPADKVVRIHLALTAYADDTYSGTPVSDPNLANNDHDIYVRRACSCQ